MESDPSLILHEEHQIPAEPKEAHLRDGVFTGQLLPLHAFIQGQDEAHVVGIGLQKPEPASVKTSICLGALGSEWFWLGSYLRPFPLAHIRHHADLLLGDDEGASSLIFRRRC